MKVHPSLESTRPGAWRNWVLRNYHTSELFVVDYCFMNMVHLLPCDDPFRPVWTDYRYVRQHYQRIC